MAQDFHKLIKYPEFKKVIFPKFAKIFEICTLELGK